ncbi:hypothetical protein AALO_G00304370 [Alosa alosa]|uniref:Immunoglobulin V-set domain-containing protein n=1 Tax=Alosa alosa TaxID=278164 RepID=A0AAV6FIB1_9TELE|nr:hypothetical protein AALO_G00304370 [Alosa alosa]
MKQPVGEKTVTIASYYASTTNYHNGFDRSGRFKLDSATNSINLTISQAQAADSATYYCGFIYYTEVTFGKGSVLFVKGGGNSRSGVFELQRGFESECPKVSIILTSLRLPDAHTHTTAWWRPAPTSSLQTGQRHQVRLILSVAVCFGASIAVCFGAS